MRAASAAVLSAVMAASMARGQIILTDGNYQYRLDPGAQGRADFLVRGAFDFLDQQWWWMRWAGPESPLPPPTEMHQVDATHATLGWNDLLGSGLDGTLALELVVTGPGHGLHGEVVQRFDLTNTGSTSRSVEMFHYLDTNPLYDPTSEHAWGGLPLIYIDEQIIAPPAEWYTGQADAFQIAETPIMLELLNDGLPDDLDNSGLPFGPGEFGGAIQWGLVLTAGETVSLHTSYKLSVPAPATCVLLGLAGWLAGKRCR